MKRIAVYGSLREGLQNHIYYMSDAQLIGTETIQGFDMYSLGMYPCITKGEGTVLFEIYDVEDDVAKAIEFMETSAGYRKASLSTKYGEAEVYVYPPDSIERYNISYKVTGGDWKDYYLKEAQR